MYSTTSLIPLIGLKIKPFVSLIKSIAPPHLLLAKTFIPEAKASLIAKPHGVYPGYANC